MIDEADLLLTRATRRMMSIFKRPVLSLSGGVDSRVVLSYLMEEAGEKFNILAYGTPNPSDDSDLGIARRLAQKYDLILHELIINLQDFTRTAPYAMRQIDGRVDIIDAPGLVPAWESLHGKFDVYVNGDQSFGWKGPVKCEKEALNAVSRWGIDAVPRLRDWLRPFARDQLTQAVERLRKQLIQEAMHSDVDALKDALFYNESLGNVLNSFAARRLPLMDLARPLLDEDVMEFVAELPAELRWRKRLLLGIFERRCGSMKVPLAARPALPSVKAFVQTFQKTPGISAFFRYHLVESLDCRLSRFFDLKKIENTLSALSNRQMLPPMREKWYDYLPMRSRFAPTPEGLVHPLITMRRLLAINLYLNSFDKEPTSKKDV